MVEFCPDCSSLLRKQSIDGKQFLMCRCGYKIELKIDTENFNKEIQKKKKALERNLIIVSEEDKISIHPIVAKDCPKCKHSEAETWQTQIRSSDEPSTHFFRCIKCKYTWREE